MAYAFHEAALRGAELRVLHGSVSQALLQYALCPTAVIRPRP